MIFVYYLALCVLALFEALSGYSWIVLISIIFLAAFIRNLYSKSKPAVILAIPIILPKFMFLVSLFFISQGLFITELGFAATGNVYSAYYTLICCTFFYILILFFNRFGKILPVVKPIRQYPLFNMAAYIAAAVATLMMMIYLLLVGVSSGFPLLEGIDRFAYRAQQEAFFDIIMSNKPILAAMLGALRFRFVRRRTARFFLDILMVGFTILITLFGEKFLSVIVLCVFYVTPYLLLKKEKVRIAGLLTFVAILTTGVSSLTYYIYSDYGKLNYTQTSERLFGRFTGQAQLWYAVMQEPQSFLKVDIKQVNIMKDALLSSEANEVAFEKRTGVFYLVLQYAPSNIAKSVFRQEGLVQFTGATEAWLIISLGHFLSVLVILVLAVFGALVILYMARSLERGSLIGYLVGVFIFLPFYSVLNQASFWQIFGWKALLYFSLGLAGDFLYRQAVGRERQESQG